MPSEVLERATTLDLYIMDAAVSYQQYVERKRQGKHQVQKPKDLSEQEMIELMERAKNAANKTR